MSSAICEVSAQETTGTLPIDARQVVTSESLSLSEEGAWVSPEARPPFPFDELIYSWNARLPEGQGFRLYLQAGFADGAKTGWQYAGFWGSVKDERPGYQPLHSHVSARRSGYGLA
jgi:hypothetical protein